MDGVLKNVYARIAYLTACTLADKCPDVSLLSGVSIDKIYQAAKKHGMGALVFSALEKVGLATTEMRNDTNKVIRKIMLLDAEREAILAELEREKIRYMPLKGVIIKELYPKIGLREMTDNDILFDESERERVRDIFSARGYDIKFYGLNLSHDVYIKEPVYNYEMHVSLLRPLALGDEMLEFFDGSMDRSLPDGNSEYRRRMTEEEFYLFMKVHEYKHYTLSGIGLRLFADTFVFLNAYGDKLDFEYVDALCEKMGISDYESTSRSLAMKLMDVDTARRLCLGESSVLTDKELDLFSYCSFSGAYGLISQEVENGIKRLEDEGKKRGFLKLRYILRRLFPKERYYEIRFPFAYKHKWARPFVLLRRFFRTLIRAPKRIIVPFITVIKYKGDNKNGKRK